MAFENGTDSYSLPAAADFSAIDANNVPTNQYKFIVVNTSGQVAIAGAGVRPDGILDNFPKQGEMARYKRGPAVRKIKLGATVGLGIEIASNGSGLAITAVTGNVISGKTLRAGVSGDIVEIEYYGYGGVKP